MRIYIGYMSALGFWRSGAAGADACPAPRVSRLSKCARTAAQTRTIAASFPMPGVGPMHLLVPSPDYRSAPGTFSYHVYSGSVPHGAFRALSDELYVAGPEFCFVQMANVLSLARLVELADELCGTYALADGGEGFVTRDRPLTTTVQLRRFIDAMPRTPGLAKARRALRMSVEGSASPAETKLEMLVCAPRLVGGAAFPPARMNYEVRLSEKSAKLAHKRLYRCDLAWPQHGVALEYNSKRFHTDNASVTADDIRKNVLEHCGMRVIVAKPYHLYNYQGFGELETQLAAALGVRRRPLTREQKLARIRLRKELLM